MIPCLRKLGAASAVLNSQAQPASLVGILTRLPALHLGTMSFNRNRTARVGAHELLFPLSQGLENPSQEQPMALLHLNVLQVLTGTCSVSFLFSLSLSFLV